MLTDGRRFHIKTSSADTLLSFMKFNISVTELKISCPNEVKSKFTDGKQSKAKRIMFPQFCSTGDAISSLS